MIEIMLQALIPLFGLAVIYKFVQLRSFHYKDFHIEFGKPKIVIAENVKRQVRHNRAKNQIKKS
jgi:hypothetical protein